ncbi:MAG TPA: putative glycoside hydrolase [Terriglobia bacterium]|nr:putative glycoside hydrolase [Terriglobia bacterium]
MPLQSDLPPKLRRVLPAIAALLVFALGFLAGRVSKRPGNVSQPPSLGPTADAGRRAGSPLVSPPNPAGHPLPSKAVGTALEARNETAQGKAAAGMTSAGTPKPPNPSKATEKPSTPPANAASSTSSSTLGEIYEVKGKQPVISVARLYLSRTSYMTVPELETAMRQANGNKRDDFFKKGDRVVIPGFLTKPVVEKPVLIPRTSEIRGIYLTGYTADSVRGIELIRRWKAAGGNAVVFDIKDFDGLVSVPFQHALAPTRKPLISDLPKYVHFLHSLGLHAIARIALFRDAYQAQNHPQLAVRSRRSGKPWLENGKLAWTDPSNPVVQSYMLDLAKTVVKSGADEIQFDYVRFPAEGDQKDAEFEFEKRHPNWKRSDVINDFLARAYGELHPMGVLVSLDVFGVMAWQRQVDLAHTGQDIAGMAHHCDVLSPMIYPSHFFGMDGYKTPGDYPRHFISESMERFRTVTADSKVVLRPWLQAFAWRTPIYSPAYIVTQVSVSKEEGGIGYLFWNARNDYAKLFPAMPQLRTAAKEVAERATAERAARRP